MKQTTACFLLREVPEMEVLLGMKKTGFGAGKYAGIGGKVEVGETVERAAVREVEEELGVNILEKNLQVAGKIIFSFPSRTEWSQEVSVFLVRSWQGKPGESDEMKPCWFRLAEIPYGLMWQDARCWLPLILEGQTIQARISFKADHETVDDVSLIQL